MSRYTDWRKILEKIPDTASKTVLELGCGEGTKILLENFNKVISWECSIEEKKKWWELCLKQFDNNPKWTGYYHLTTYWEELNKINQVIVETKGKTRTLDGISGSGINNYWKDLTNKVNLKKVDVAFVDQGFHQRGETVLEFCNEKVPYIFWHDTKCKNIYGYDLVEKRLNSYGYKIIATHGGCGTALAKLIK